MNKFYGKNLNQLHQLEINLLVLDLQITSIRKNTNNHPKKSQVLEDLSSMRTKMVYTCMENELGGDYSSVRFSDEFEGRNEIMYSLVDNLFMN